MAVAALSGARSSSCLLCRLFKMPADIQTTVTGLKVVLTAGWLAFLSCKAARAARKRTEAASKGFRLPIPQGLCLLPGR